MRFLWMNLYIGFLGIVFLAIQAFSIFLAIKAKPKIDENPIKHLHKRGAIIAARCFIVMGLMLATGMEDFGFLEPLFGQLRIILNSIGSLYFPISFILDMIVYMLLHQRERCLEDGIVALNLLCIPFITLAAVLMATPIPIIRGRGSRKAEEPGIRIGYVVRLLRRIVGQASVSGMLNQPITVRGEKWEVRNIPKGTFLRYDPESMPNPHIGVFGASGQGKSTHALYLMYKLSKRYRLIVLDLKGDFSDSAESRGWIGKGLAEIIDVQGEGINPLINYRDELRRLNSVTRLIEAISVVEDLGSNQRAVLVSASRNLEPFTYEMFKKRVEKQLEDAMKGYIGGPHIRDAYTGLYNRIRLSNSIFRSNGKIDELNITLSWEGAPIRLYNMSSISDEKLRALAAEWILRVIYERARERGPTAFLREDKIFLVVDEAHELARAQRSWRRDMTRSILEDLARKGRSYGVNLMVITQRLSDLADGLRSNCSGMWIIFRDSAPSDIRILTSLTSCPVIGQVLSNLKLGEAMILRAEPKVLDNLRIAYDRPVAVTVATIVKTARLKLTARKTAPRRVEKPLRPLVTSPPIRMRTHITTSRENMRPDSPRRLAPPIDGRMNGSASVPESIIRNSACSGGEIDGSAWTYSQMLSEVRMIREKISEMDEIKTPQVKTFLLSLPDDVIVACLDAVRKGIGFRRLAKVYRERLGLGEKEARFRLRFLYKACREIMERGGVGA